MAFFILE